MHYPGRSEILDKLAESQNSEQAPHYDIRALSREILLRIDSNQVRWQDAAGSLIVLTRSTEYIYTSYELLVREAEDKDVHSYEYNGYANQIKHTYPLGTWHKGQDAAELNSHIEQILLTGPTMDKVPTNHTEEIIQKRFATMAGRLVMENLAGGEQDARSDIYAKYILAADESLKMKLYRNSTTSQLSSGRCL